MKVDYFKGRENRIGWYASKFQYRKAYLSIIGIWAVLILLLLTVTIWKWGTVADQYVALNHQFVAVHNNH